MKRILLPALILASCSDPVISPPISLRSPSAIAIADGERCFEQVDEVESISIVRLAECGENKVPIAFVTNEQSDRVTALNMSENPPQLINFDPSTPGVTHLNVGRLPVDIATSPNGRLVYTLNQLDRDISVISLNETQPIVLDERIRLEETPITFEVHPTTNQIIVAQGSPSTLRIFEEPTDAVGPGDLLGTRFDLPATVTDFKVHPSGESLWIAYRDLDRISVFTFEGECLEPGESAPCIAAEIGTTFDCSDGIDNDGDGNIDAEDSQCFGPSGSESPEGIGRVAEPEGELAGCSNGEDDDNDGMADRDDPDCIRPSLEEDGDFGSTPVTACNDGVDNDGDGMTDLADDGCYGPFGRTEESTRSLGLDRISFDQLGLFAYGVDRVNSEVVVFDAQRGVLIDAPKTITPRLDGFSDTVGVTVTSSPLAVFGTIRPFCTPNENSAQTNNENNAQTNNAQTNNAQKTPSDCIFRAGAYVSNDAGTIQFVHAGNFLCKLNDTVNVTDFINNDDGLDQEVIDCMTVPDLNDPDAENGCSDGEPGLCSVINETMTFFDPRFSLLDDFTSSDGRVIEGLCEQPAAILEAMEEFARQNPTNQNFTCDSPLMPQPIDNIEVDDGFERAVPITRPVLEFDPETGDVVQVNEIFDQALVNETWTVTYEGVIDRTDRSDAIFPTEVQGDTLNVVTQIRGCGRGIEVGDHFIVRSTADDACPIQPDEFDENNEPIDNEDFWTFEVVGFSQGSVDVAIIPDSQFAQQFPTRTCFPEGTSYEIRAIDTWVVVGDDSGFVSDQTSVFDTCVTRPGDTSRHVARVKTGEMYNGPYLSFLLWEGITEGAVPPVRDLAFEFDVERNFSSLRFNTERPLPIDLLIEPVRFPGNDGDISTDDDIIRIWLLSVDPEANAIYANDVLDTSGPAFLIR